MVLFLEEDHYVAEDFLHVLRLMERTCKLSCERCNVLSLGTYLKTYNYFTDFSRKVRALRILGNIFVILLCAMFHAQKSTNTNTGGYTVEIRKAKA